jgi:hypothetical protein
MLTSKSYKLVFDFCYFSANQSTLKETEGTSFIFLIFVAFHPVDMEKQFDPNNVLTLLTSKPST